MSQQRYRRAQSETIGVVILVGVFAVTATIVGVVIIGNVTDQADDEPLLDVNATATTDNVTLTHTGGDTVDVDDVDVILRQGSQERRDGLETYTELRGNSDGRFGPGEERYRSNPYGDTSIRVIVVHVPTNAVLYDESIAVETTTDTLSFSEPSTSSPACSTYSYDGSGTDADPYRVTNDTDLQCMGAFDATATYELTTNIDATETDQWNGGDGFDPIGGPFEGTLNGSGYVVKGLTIDRASTNDVGLFAATSGAVVRNLSLTEASVTGADRTGLLVGEHDGTVRDVTAGGTVTGGIHTGGLVGQNGGLIADAETDVEVDGGDETGGLAGQNGVSGSGQIYQSSANGSVTGGNEVGGLVGYQEVNEINDTYATVDVTGNDRVGGLIGEVGGADLTDSYAAGPVSGSSSVGGAVGSDVFGGTIEGVYWDTQESGQSSSDGGTGLTTTEMQGDNAPTNMSAFDWAFDWTTVSGDYPALLDEPLSGPTPDCDDVSYSGSGTDGDPYEISNDEQLQCIEDQGLGAVYELTGDVDASGTADWALGAGFDPVGDTGSRFTGELRGGSYEVQDLTIDRPNEGIVGLFGAIGGSGTIENVTLVNASVTGGETTGGLAGNQKGTIRNVTAGGTVTGSIHTGGLVGQNGGLIADAETDVEVDGGDETGGLAGQNGDSGSGRIYQSSANGSVTGNNQVGGLVGYQEVNEINDTYATVDVTGNDEVGGLIGRHGSAELNNSYATGPVSGSSSVGGAIGIDVFSGTSTVEGVYWDTQESGQSSSDGGTGLTTSEMQGSSAETNMPEFDFVSTWTTVSGDYPAFQS